MRQMYDAADILNVPRDAELIGYYVDGAYVPSAASFALFPHARFIPIAVFPSDNRGIVFDGPPDNSTWDRTVDWVVMRRAAGVDPTVYTNASEWPGAVNTFRNRGVAPPHWWIAKWDGNQTVMAGAVAHQYQGSEHGGYDRSVALDYWPGVDNAPGPAPAPKPTAATPPLLGDDEMLIVQVNPVASANFGGVIALVSGPMVASFANTDDVLKVKAAGVPLVDISLDTYNNLVEASAALKGKLTGSLGVSGNLTVA